MCVLKSKKRDTSRDSHESLQSPPHVASGSDKAKVWEDVRWEEGPTSFQITRHPLLLGNPLPWKVGKRHREKCNRGQQRISLSFIFPRQESSQEEAGTPNGSGWLHCSGHRASNPALQFLEKYTTGLWSQGTLARCRERALWSRRGASRCGAALTLLWLRVPPPADFAPPTGLCRELPRRTGRRALQPPRSRYPHHPWTHLLYPARHANYTLTIFCKKSSFFSQIAFSSE